MTTATPAVPTRHQPELLAQTVVVIGGSPGIGLKTARRRARGQARRAVRDAAHGRAVGPADVAALAAHLMANTAVTGATDDIDGGQQFVA